MIKKIRDIERENQRLGSELGQTQEHFRRIVDNSKNEYNKLH